MATHGRDGWPGEGWSCVCELWVVALVFAFSMSWLCVSDAHARSADLIVKSVPSGATVYLDGKAMGKAPYSFFQMKPGRYLISIAKKGYMTQDLLVQHGTKTKLVTLRLAKASGLLHLTSVPSGARVLIHRRFRGYTPLKLRLPVGRYQVHVRKIPHVPRMASVVIKNDETSRLHLLLKHRYGWLKVSSEPSRAKVYIDGVFVGKTPLLKRVPLGRRLVVVRTDLFQVASQIAYVIPVGIARLKLTLPCPKRVSFPKNSGLFTPATLSHLQINQVLSINGCRLLYCGRYGKKVKAINMSWAIYKSGRVGELTVHPTIPARMYRCIGEELRKWRFPRFTGEDIKISKWRLKFR